jgi:hypothetical protein
MRTVFHIGFHKTGTTTLQRGLFPNLPGTAYAGEGAAGTTNVFGRMAENLWSADDGEYLEGTISGFLEDISHGAEALVASNEGWSLRPRDGRTPERLRRLAPDAHVLVCIRDQRTALASLYYMFLTRGGCLSFADWITSPHFEIDRLRYDVTIGQYQDVFGAERVRTLVYEDLVADPAGFFTTVARYVRPDLPDGFSAGPVPHEHRSLSPTGRTSLRIMNRLIVRSSLNPKPPLGRFGPGGSKFRLLRGVDARVLRHLAPDRSEPSVIAERILPLAAESNRCLEQMTGLDLAAYGYPLA